MRNIFVGLALFGSASIGMAGAFTNGSFETPGISGIRFFGAGNDTFVTGWTHVRTATAGIEDFYSQAGTGFNVPAADNGSFYIGFGGTGSTGGILFQTFDTVIGTTYTVNYRLTTQQLGGSSIPIESTLVEAL